MYRVTDGKFTTKHALVFTVNNLFGPDISSFLPTVDSFLWGGVQIPEIYFFFHGYGWPIIALLLVFPWKLLLKTLSRKSKGADYEDSEFYKDTNLNLRKIYFLIVAGGLLHLFVDIIGHPSYITLGIQENYPWGAVWVGWTTDGSPLWVSITDIWGTGMFPCGNRHHFFETYIFYAICVIVFFGVLFIYAHKTETSMIKSFYGLVIFFLVPLIIFYFISDYSGFDINGQGVNYYGNPNNVHATYRLVGGEADLGVSLFFLILFFVPFLLIYKSIKPDLQLIQNKKKFSQVELKAQET
ncbi:MAG TPA: hypothetical protein ENH75_14530 [archaeon]|nr:hypothetical protein [archaeon]